ncbi:hypothetical protein DAPPUDRAFT_115636 [Daphnia pulex]|uniref:Uncharacterized protein n=1 Tax=Daphnia pulex TaxID=6669 RepID=E9HM24_DAPPU|nr:hypothetical protein DAPPUDRAFT_115636 [Daphnia pulex]|eukprot:EFX67160.1 hypothetical protein DAPPUDRAFT_115636 [Daphnia pulex]
MKSFPIVVLLAVVCLAAFAVGEARDEICHSQQTPTTKLVARRTWPSQTATTTTTTAKPTTVTTISSSTTTTAVPSTTAQTTATTTTTTTTTPLPISFNCSVSDPSGRRRYTTNTTAPVTTTEKQQLDLLLILSMTISIVDDNRLAARVTINNSNINQQTTSTLTQHIYKVVNS